MIQFSRGKRNLNIFIQDILLIDVTLVCDALLELASLKIETP